jgi:HK97 family phage major capsid protein
MVAMKNIEGKKFQRDMVFDNRSVDEAARTVELAFSSETPYERYWGFEVLDHSGEAVDLGRLADGAPLLLNHDADCQIGVVLNARIDPDRIGRATVKFSRSEEGQEIFQDVIDGIRRKVSVGYIVKKMTLLEKGDGMPDSYLVSEWEPLEISLVSVPADNTVGVGRSAELPEQPEKPEQPVADEPQELEVIPTKQESIMENEVVPAAATVDKADLLLKKFDELKAVGLTYKEFGGLELATEMFAQGKSVADLQNALLQRMGAKRATAGDMELGLSEKEKGNFGFLRLLNAMANPNDAAAQKAAGFEIEVCNEAAKKNPVRRERAGFHIPYEVLSHRDQNAYEMMTRTNQSGNFSTGGALVPQNYLAASFIDLLRNKSALEGAGVTTLNGLTGNVTIPRQTGATTASWVGESIAANESNAAFGQLTLSPKTLTSNTKISRRLMIQSSPDVEALVRNDMALQMALAQDLAAFYGTGTNNQPLGIKFTSGINTVDFSAAAPTFAELVDLETKVDTANALMGGLGYITNAAMVGLLKTTVKVANYPVFLLENGEANGYRVHNSNQIATGDIFFGNFADVIIARWAGMDLIVDPYTNSTSGDVAITTFMDTDIALRHPVSFSRGNNTL